jgi:hypothetical protein
MKLVSSLAWGIAIALSVAAGGCNGIVQVENGGAGCPAEIVDGQACSNDGAACKGGAAGKCEIEYACTSGTWQPKSSSCTTPCEDADYGESCLTVGETCGSYGECGGSEATCLADHTWDVTYYDDACCYEECNCDPFYCPEVPATEGQSCDPCSEASACGYVIETPCGTQEVTTACGQDYLWHETTPPASCNCAYYENEGACGGDPKCRFLAGGCEAPNLAQPGCFPAVDCSDQAPCPDGTVCTAVNANKCVADPCIECVAVSLCL